MSFGAPLGGLFALALPVLGFLYLLRVERAHHIVSSTMMWKRAVRDHHGSVPWRRPRLTALLVLQLLAAAALVLALTQPRVVHGARPGGHTIVILDVSATMQATDAAPSRLDVARQQAGRMLDDLVTGATVTVIAMGQRPRVTGDRVSDVRGARAALESLRAENGEADLADALALAAASATGGSSTRLEVYSDGIVSPLIAAVRLPFPVTFHSVGSSGEDLAISAISVTPSSGGRTVAARVTNRGRQHQAATLIAQVDGHVADAKPVDLDGGAAADLSIGLPASAAHVELRLDSHDVLALDDVVYAVAQAPHTYRVLLVTDRNLFLQSALALRSDLTVTLVAPSKYQPDSSYDLAIFDGYVPARPPGQPAWYLAPPADVRLGTGDEVNVGRVQPSVAQDPLVSDVDLSTVHIARSRALTQSSFGRPLITSDEGPLVLVRDTTPRAVLFGFDLHETDLSLQAAFPILVDHLTAFLIPQAVPPRSHEPGDPIDLTAPSPSAVVAVTRPDGTRFTLTGGGVIGGADTQLTGFYTVTVSGAAGHSVPSSFAVNALDPGRGSISPREVANVSGPAQSSQATTTSTLDLWPYLAAVALVLLSAEWVIWTRSR